jgi:hypothetical protein
MMSLKDDHDCGSGAISSLVETTVTPKWTRSLINWLLAANLTAAFIAIAAVAIVPTGSRVIVIGAPWAETGHMVSIIAKADGSIVNGGVVDWIAIAEGNPADFSMNLLRSGALLGLDGRLASACIGTRK